MGEDFNLVDYRHIERVAVITLDSPDNSNAMSVAMLRELKAALDDALTSDEIRAIVLAANGRNFCAGADLRDKEAGANQSVIDHLEFDHGPILRTIYEAPKPIIAAVQGAAAGVGSAYAMVCDLSVMSEDAYIYQAFLTIGLLPDGGANWLLGHQLPYKRAFELIADGTKLDAATCLEWGLTNKVCARDELGDTALAWAQRLSERAPLAMGAAKQQLRAVFEQTYSQTISTEARYQKKLIESEDSREAISAFFQKRKPEFSGR